MTQFNIIGKGFLDVNDPADISFKSKNPWFCFAEIELGRSTEFTIPATNKNKMLLGFGDDPSEYGDALRSKHECQMVFDGGVKDGTLTVTAYSGDAFRCVYYMDNASWIDRLQGMKLADVPIGDQSVVWDLNAQVVDANNVTPTLNDFVKLVKYDNGGISNWQLTPSVNVTYFVHAILNALGVPYSPFIVQPDPSHWLIAGSLKNGITDVVELSQNDTMDVQISQTQGLLSVTTQYIEWAKALVFGAYIGGGRTAAQCFRVEKNMKMTFGVVPADIYLIKWNVSLKHCRCIGGYSSTQQFAPWVNLSMFGGFGTDLTGQTIEWKKDDIFFFADYMGNIITSNYFTNPQIFTGEDYFGWKDTLHPFKIVVTLSADEELELGETWRLRYNMPDMTVFEFLKSVALSSACEMSVSPVELALMEGFYGQRLGNQFFKSLDKVVSVDKVERQAWDDNRHNIVAFDSEDYVTEPIVTDYEVANGNLTNEERHVIKFSEGAVGSNGILVQDATGTPTKFTAKKWTLARVDTNAASPDYLQRVLPPVANGYDDIAGNSTCVTLKAVMTLSEFMGLSPMDVFVWRGMGYVWSDVNWTQGIATMTLKRVSKPVAESLQYDAEVEWLESDGPQFIDTGLVPDGFTGIKADFELTGHAGMVAGLEDMGGDVFGIGANSSGYYANFGNAVPYSNVNYMRGTAALNFYGDGQFIGEPDGGSTVTVSLGTLPFNPVGKIGLFGWWYHTSQMKFTNCKIKAFQVTQSNFLVLDLIPVRVGSVGYMYDRVSGQLFGNVGTGDFIVGPDV